MSISTLRHLAFTLPLSLVAFGGGALGGCANNDGDPTPDAADQPTEIAASEGCEDDALLAENGISKDECLAAPVVAYDPNSGEANTCTPGTLLHKAVDKGPPRVVFICKCRQGGVVDCFLRN